MATDFNCSSCRHSRAEGQCPNCTIVLCQPCYNHHQCGTSSAPEPEAPANLQCVQCHTEPATCLCLCKYPCQVFCRECYGKHSNGLPIHFSLPIMYLSRLRSLDEFKKRKARYANMQRLYSDITSAVNQIGDYRKAFESKLADLGDRLDTLRRSMSAEIENAQSAMQAEENNLGRSFTEILMSEPHADSSAISRLIDTDYPSSSTFEFKLEFDPVLVALGQAASFQSPLLNQLRPLLPPQTPSHLVPGGRLNFCNGCGNSFTAQPDSDLEPMQKLSGIWKDFCSFACLERVLAPF